MPSYASKRSSDPVRQAALAMSETRFGRVYANHSSIETLRTIVPFQNFALFGISAGKLNLVWGVVLATDLPESYIRQLLDEELVANDPLAGCVLPQYCWASADNLSAEEISQPAAQRISMLNDAFEIPTRRLLGLYQGDFLYGGAQFYRKTPFSKQEAFILEMTVRVIHNELSGPFLASMNACIGLSEGELACLKLFADGLEIADVSSITGYSPDTIYTYSKSASRKMGVRGRMHCIAEALRRQMIP